VELSPREEGIVIGLLLTQGSFGGDGRQPHVIVKMHVRHERLLRWLAERIPGSRMYGPYAHGGREYFQWMARGRALVENLLPLLDAHATPELDPPAAERLAALHEKYGDVIERLQRRAGQA
jgi:hypothetical protein